jgi:outer membrane protein assembly factor BamA
MLSIGQSKSDSTEQNFSFVPIPYINYNRSMGFSFGGVPMVMYKLNKSDTISPSSLSGAIVIYTTEKTWFAMVFNKLYFNEDRWRATLFGGRGNINFQFFFDHPLNPGYIDYNTIADIFMIEMQRKIVGDLYAGVNFTYLKMITNFEVEDGVEQTDYFYGLGAVVSFDNRNDVYYPNSGILVNLKLNTYPEFLDNKFVSQKLELDYNHFIEMKNEKDVVAMRLYGGLGLGDLNFNQQFVVGRNDIRGYTQGKYRGNQILALQTEYRWNPFKKLGFVGFAGIASVFNAINDTDSGKLLPGAGAGIRYMVIPKNKMNVGMDIAFGDGDWGLYFKIGETF